MTLIPEDIRARLLANGAEITTNDDHIPLIKLINPRGRGCWLISEIDPERPNRVFALSGINYPTLGYIEFDEPNRRIGRLKLPVERVSNFTAQYTLSVYLFAARRAKQIIENETLLAEVKAHLQSINQGGAQ